MRIVIKFRDGTEREFPDERRSGGSYANSIRYEGSFVVVKDPWDKETAFPVDMVAEVKTWPRW